MDWIGWDGWMVIIGQQFSKSTFGAKKYCAHENCMQQWIGSSDFFSRDDYVEVIFINLETILFNMALFEVAFISFFPVIVFRDSNMAVPTH